MSKHHESGRLRSFFGNSRKTPQRNRGRGRNLSLERLESRQMLSITLLSNISTSANTGEKPQSKVFQYADQWWTVMPSSSGTWIYRLDGTTWNATQRITTNSSVHADVKVDGNLVHVLLFNGTATQLATLQYDAPDNRFDPWAQQPDVVDVPLASGVETATVEVDSTGRMWIASDAKTTVEVRYSDGDYTDWSAPITIASGINTDDISAIIAMPNHQIGVFWSDQSTDRFGFRLHADGADPNTWSADEVPAGQSALNIGSGMADDHMHLAVSSDGTLYAAVKTSYDKSAYPKMALLVRRPNGSWDDLYEVDNGGTRPVVVVDEAAGKLIVAYESKEGGGPILYRESPLGTIDLSPIDTMISGTLENVTTTKVTSNNQIVFMADNKSVLFTFDTTTGTPNAAPVVNAGPDGTGAVGSPVALDGTATDDGQPSPANLTLQWSMISGPGSVSFGNSGLADTSATFSAAGTYVLQLRADDGQFSRTDTVSIVVSAGSGGGTGDPGNPDPGKGSPQQIAFQNGLFPNVAYAGTTDTKIAAGKKPSKKNYGNDTKMTVDGSPDEAGLFRWDVSAIPVGSTVTSVSIEFTVTSSSKETYEVYALERAWDELSATWQQYASGASWSGAGATGASDADSAVLGLMSPTSKGTYRINLNDAGKAAVQAWINDASLNYGVIIKDYNNSKAFAIATSEVKTTSQRPKLIIDYTAPPANLPPVINAGPDLAGDVDRPVAITATVTDDGQPSSAVLVPLWTVVSGPGNVSFGDDHVVSTTAQFDTPGDYTLRLTVSDGLASGFDEISVAVT
jgi:hypothetical protein